jgi:adenine phosphoribosyltransferase
MIDPRLDLIRSRIRDVPDFPKSGILFKDITPLLADPVAFRTSIDLLAEQVHALAPEVVVGIESRGFLFGAPLACTLGLGFVPVRKPGKLPSATTRVDYDLEYGTDAVEMHTDALSHGARALVVDDVIATGGTARATCELVRRLGAQPIAAAFLLELTFLDGGAKLAPIPTVALVRY